MNNKASEALVNSPYLQIKLLKLICKKSKNDCYWLHGHGQIIPNNRTFAGTGENQI